MSDVESVILFVVAAWLFVIVMANRGARRTVSPPVVWPRECVGCGTWRLPTDKPCCAPNLPGHHSTGAFR